MTPIQTSDILPVRSRVSWGAIVAGAVIAFAVYLLLGTLGLAMGVTVSDRAEPRTLSAAAGIWAALAMLASLFVGGCVASQCTAGETKSESVIYGVLVWGVFLGAMMIFAAGVAGVGLASAVGMANSPAANAVTRLSDEDLKATGLNDEQIARMREKAATMVSDPRTKAGAWWTFGGLMASLLAAIFGAVVGSGPDLITASVRVRAVGMTQESPARETANR